MVKQVLKYVWLIVLATVEFTTLYFLAALILSIIAVAPEKNGGNDVAIFILNNGVHTDLALPLKSTLIDWSSRIKPPQNLEIGNQKYIALGCGNKEFYLETPTWSDLKFSTAFKAAFGLGQSAMHTSYYGNLDESDDCIRIDLSLAQYGKLIKYIDSAFKKDSSGQYIRIYAKIKYSPDDAFYDANQRYSLFFTSNTWTNNALKSCGQKACLWTPFEEGIFYHYSEKKKIKDRLK